MPSTAQPAYLLLADGHLFTGRSFGKTGTATGEICFNTGMTGYQEVFTDPSYYGQVIIMNAAHIGNYGTKPVDVESKTVKVSGIIARNLADKFSRPQADRSLEQYLIDNQVVAIHGIDTRALVTHVRQCGAMNCIISSDTSDIVSLQQTLAAVPSMEGLNLSSFVSTCAFTSGTTNFFVGSILQAELLSITYVPTSANLGAHSNEVSPPAEKIATSGFIETAVSKPTTLNDCDPNEISCPTDFSEATGINSVIGKFCSRNTVSITLPTIPVAPTTATFIFKHLDVLTKITIFERT
ncbi:MAG: hypothetical protein FGM61_02275 [Sediminibacterium sp.]|nr:hypothetical protein [Sediminibacterium sp.]